MSMWTRLRAWMSRPDVIVIGGQWPEPMPDAPECGTFDAPVCLVDLTPDDSPVRRICGRLLPCEEHR